MTLAGNTEEDFRENMRSRSGRVNSRDPLVEFFYLLIRNDVPLTKVEEIVKEIEKNPDENILFTNGWLANYAKDAVARIREIAESRKEEA